jgi:hypothetical protein
MPPTGTLEIELRRSSCQDLLERLERTTGLRLTVRRARVTTRKSRWLLEFSASGPTPSPAAR